MFYFTIFTLLQFLFLLLKMYCAVLVLISRQWFCYLTLPMGFVNNRVYSTIVQRKEQQNIQSTFLSKISLYISIFYPLLIWNYSYIESPVLGSAKSWRIYLPKIQKFYLNWYQSLILRLSPWLMQIDHGSTFKRWNKPIL